jgi:hypothetical protein
MATLKSIRPIPKLTEKDIARFWSKVCKVDDPEVCWKWIGTLTNKGYGVFSVRHTGYPAHRIANYIDSNNDPGTLYVLHTCDVRGCVRPSHLFRGTHEDNMADMTAKGRAAAGDLNGARLHPETRMRGAKHWCHKNPEKFAITLEKLAKGRGKWKGEDQWYSKLKEADVIEIRKLWPSKTLKEIANIFGVSIGCINGVVSRASWKHIIP